jgi:hypothetical protein
MVAIDSGKKSEKNAMRRSGEEEDGILFQSRIAAG